MMAAERRGSLKVKHLVDSRHENASSGQRVWAYFKIITALNALLHKM